MTAKSPTNIYCSQCFFKCTENFTEDDRKTICREFTAASYEKQRDIILSRVKKFETSRNRKRYDSGRSDKTSVMLITF